MIRLHENLRHSMTRLQSIARSIFQGIDQNYRLEAEVLEVDMYSTTWPNVTCIALVLNINCFNFKLNSNLT